MRRNRTFVPDCPTLTEKERKWHDEERERNREKRKGKSRKYVEFEEEFDILNAPSGLTVRSERASCRERV